MEEKINKLIDIMKFWVEVDRGVSNEYRDWILKVLKELEEE